MRQEKQFLLEEVEQLIDKHGSFVITRYAKLNANLASKFRRDIQDMGCIFEVMRKTMLVKASEKAGVPLSLDALDGHIGLVFSGKDPIETAKFIIKFGEENDKTVQVIGGRVDGKLYSGAEMDRLSKLPGKDEMRAQLLSVLEAPMSHTLGCMDAIVLSVVYCLANKAEQK